MHVIAVINNIVERNDQKFASKSIYNKNGIYGYRIFANEW